MKVYIVVLNEYYGYEGTETFILNVYKDKKDADKLTNKLKSYKEEYKYLTKDLEPTNEKYVMDYHILNIAEIECVEMELE